MTAQSHQGDLRIHINLFLLSPSNILLRGWNLVNADLSPFLDTLYFVKGDFYFFLIEQSVHSIEKYSLKSDIFCGLGCFRFCKLFKNFLVRKIFFINLLHIFLLLFFTNINVLLSLLCYLHVTVQFLASHEVME